MKKKKKLTDVAVMCIYGRFDLVSVVVYLFFFQAEDGIRDHCVTGVQTCALPIYAGKREEAEALRANLPLIEEKQISRAYVDAINGNTILTADRFVYSPLDRKSVV